MRDPHHVDSGARFGDGFHIAGRAGDIHHGPARNGGMRHQARDPEHAHANVPPQARGRDSARGHEVPSVRVYWPPE